MDIMGVKLAASVLCKRRRVTRQGELAWLAWGTRLTGSKLALGPMCFFGVNHARQIGEVFISLSCNEPNQGTQR